MIDQQLLMIDLENDPAVIAAYEAAHRPGVTPAEVIHDLRASGYKVLEIWRLGTRLVMRVERDSSLAAPGYVPAVQVLTEWDDRMSALQRPIDGCDGWAPMVKIFDLDEH